MSYMNFPKREAVSYVRHHQGINFKWLKSKRNLLYSSTLYVEVISPKNYYKHQTPIIVSM
jgi:hypothetical protein